MKRKNAIVVTLVISVLALIIDFTGPFWIENFQKELSISIAGTIISTAALVIAVIEIIGIKEANEAIKIAVQENSRAIRRIGNVYDIAKHIQMIFEIHGMINAEKWEIAHLRMLELYTLLGNIKSNLEEYGIETRDINLHIDHIADDLRLINKAMNGYTINFPDQILNHLDEVSPLLTTICTNLKTKTNDNKSA